MSLAASQMERAYAIDQCLTWKERIERASGVPPLAREQVIYPVVNIVNPELLVHDEPSQRCGAKTRKGTPCQCLPVTGKKRCKFHGGLSTGPRTPEGIERIRAARRGIRLLPHC